jgi:hypothetical protein
MVPATGYSRGEINVPEAMHRLEKYISEFPRLYEKFTAKELLHKQFAGKWSKQEILGHLIDSAINNLRRFTEIQFLPQPYVIVPYKQDELVIVNNYQYLPTEHLIQLWQLLNRQIIYVVEDIPKEKLSLAVDPRYDNGETKTLSWIVVDYVAHMEHHMKQIFSR